MPGFRPCSARPPRSQAPFCQCARSADFHPARGDRWAPPLPFGRRPPQSNYPPATVCAPAYGSALGSRRVKSGISPLPPPRPQARVHWLPPILRITRPDAMASCSKAPWGLFVLLWVARIFTGLSISPGPSLRQCPDRYAFRAGRNLPDKEFRYLRTVIVTAAVYWGFGSELAPLPLTFQHWAGISRYTSTYVLAPT